MRVRLSLMFSFIFQRTPCGGQRVLIAGTQSGCGKTTMTLALMQYVRAQGLTVAPFKAGPDFLDPMWHKVACGRISYNLDTRMVGIDESLRLLRHHSEHTHLSIIEGVMGMFDGRSGVGGEGSSAHLAQALDEPVLLVVSAKGMSGSIVPLVEGFAARAKAMGVRMVGVMANHVGSPNHANILRTLLDEYDLPPLLAWMGKGAPQLPERHLGLKMPSEGDLPDFSEHFHVEGDWCSAPARHTPMFSEEHAASMSKQDDMPRHSREGGNLSAETHGQSLEIPALAEMAKACTPSSASHMPSQAQQPMQPLHLRGQRIAVAKDAAFCFIYPANIAWLKMQGAEVVYFSPLAGDGVPEDADALWLPGGYPELHREALSQSPALASIADFIASDKPTLAECGGMMVLGAAMDGVPMAGVLPFHIYMQDKLASLGYREEQNGVRGHEFHHSKREDFQGMKPCFDVQRGDAGMRHQHLRASYIHWYFPSQPEEVVTWFGSIGDNNGHETQRT